MANNKKDRAINYNRILRDCVRQFPLKSNRWTDHGPLHWLQVLRNVECLAAYNQKGVDLVVCRLFAYTHDSCRMNEYKDPLHGARAAEFVEANLTTWGLSHFNEARLSVLREALIQHDYGKTSRHATIGTCWDADRLDLPRVRIIPDPKKMSTEAGKAFCHKTYTEFYRYQERLEWDAWK